MKDYWQPRIKEFYFEAIDQMKCIDSRDLYISGNQLSNVFSEVKIEHKHCLKNRENETEACEKWETAEDWFAGRNCQEGQVCTGDHQILINVDYVQVNMKNISHPVQHMTKMYAPYVSTNAWRNEIHYLSPS